MNQKPESNNKPGWQKALWFVGLWLLGVFALAIIGSLIKLFLG